MILAFNVKFLMLNAVDILQWIILCCGELCLYHRVFSNVAGPYLWHSSSPLPCLSCQILQNVPLGVKSPLVGNHCFNAFNLELLSILEVDNN
jgi:hypothetical protein